MDRCTSVDVCGSRCRCGCGCKRCEKINLGKHIDSKSHDVNFRNNVGSCWPGHFGRLLRPVNRKALHDLPRLVCSHCCGATVLLLSQWIARLGWRPSSRASHSNWTRYGRMWREARPLFLDSASQWRINFSYVHWVWPRLVSGLIYPLRVVFSFHFSANCLQFYF